MSSTLTSTNEEPCSSCGLLLDVEESSLLALVRCPRCRSEVRVRSRFGSYELLDVLGEGGSSRVFRARPDQQRDPDYTSSEVALKVLEITQPDYSENLFFLRNEAKHAALIGHPRVVKVMALEEEEGGACLAMEIMKGGSLHDRIVSGSSLDEQWILESGLEILKALSAAYAKKVIHRDLKPANILFSGSGGAKLADFGLARSLAAVEEGESESAIEHHLMATPDYVAPELLEGEVGDCRSDLYGLGGCLYHAITCEPPYRTEEKSLEELRELKRRPIQLSFKKWNLLPETSSLVNRMLAPDPRDRFASYDELEKAFRQALDRLESLRKNPSQCNGGVSGWLSGIFHRVGKS